MKPKILFISQQFPYPLTDGGNIRSFQILQALAQSFEVTLIANISPGADRDESLSAVREFCGDAVCLPHVKSKSLLALAKVALRSLLRRVPLAIAWNYNPYIQREVASRLAKDRFDAVHCNHLDTVQYLPKDTGGRKQILDTHNLLFQFYAKAAELEPRLFHRALLRIEAAPHAIL